MGINGAPIDPEGVPIAEQLLMDWGRRAMHEAAGGAMARAVARYGPEAALRVNRFLHLLEHNQEYPAVEDDGVIEQPFLPPIRARVAPHNRAREWISRELAAALRLRTRLGMNESNFEYLINQVLDPALLARMDPQMRDRIARAIVEE